MSDIVQNRILPSADLREFRRVETDKRKMLVETFCQLRGGTQVLNKPLALTQTSLLRYKSNKLFDELTTTLTER